MSEQEMSEQEMFEQTFKRPKNFFKLSTESQWNIDAELGILDWQGKFLSLEEQERFHAHYSTKQKKQKC